MGYLVGINLIDYGIELSETALKVVTLIFIFVAGYGVRAMVKDWKNRNHWGN